MNKYEKIIQLDKQASMDKEALRLSTLIAGYFAAQGLLEGAKAGKKSYDAFRAGKTKQGFQQAGWAAFNTAMGAADLGWAGQTLRSSSRLANQASHLLMGAKAARAAGDVKKAVAMEGKAKKLYSYYKGAMKARKATMTANNIKKSTNLARGAKSTRMTVKHLQDALALASGPEKVRIAKRIHALQRSFGSGAAVKGAQISNALLHNPASKMVGKGLSYIPRTFDRVNQLPGEVMTRVAPGIGGKISRGMIRATTNKPARILDNYTRKMWGMKGIVGGTLADAGLSYAAPLDEKGDILPPAHPVHKRIASAAGSVIPLTPTQRNQLGEAVAKGIARRAS